MPAPKTGPSVFTRVFFYALALAIIGVGFYANGQDDLTGETSGAGWLGLFILSVSALMAQFAIAGWAASMALEEWHARHPPGD